MLSGLIWFGFYIRMGREKDLSDHKRGFVVGTWINQDQVITILKWPTFSSIGDASVNGVENCWTDADAYYYYY